MRGSDDIVGNKVSLWAAMITDAIKIYLEINFRKFINKFDENYKFLQEKKLNYKFLWEKNKFLSLPCKFLHGNL